MAKHSSQEPLGRMNRRKMLGTTTALIGGAIAGVGGDAFAQEKAHTPRPERRPAKSQPRAAGGPGQGRKAPRPQGRQDVLLPRHPLRGSGAVRIAQAGRSRGPASRTPRPGGRSARVRSRRLSAPTSSCFRIATGSQNEHCQYLNVWTQNLTPAAKKPVMVWMHGGGFTNGSSMESYAYDGRSLSEFGDVVVVSVNHRLNILGTLDLSAYGPQYANSRYTGTADLVAALQWVHDNIESFGGDPGNVMIFGQSGGGGKVVRMLHTPDAKGLFHKVAAQSGGNNTYRTTDPRREHQGAADDRGAYAQEPEPDGRPDRQAEDGAVFGADHRRHRGAAVGGRRSSAGPRSTGKSSPTISM